MYFVDPRFLVGQKRQQEWKWNGQATYNCTLAYLC